MGRHFKSPGAGYYQGVWGKGHRSQLRKGLSSAWGKELWEEDRSRRVEVGGEEMAP